MQKHQFTVLATDVILLSIVDGELKVLLMKMKKEPYLEHWAVPGGLINPNETIEESAMRQLESRVGIKNIYLEQLYTFGDLDRDPFGRVVSVAYFALLPKEAVNVLKATDEVQWHSFANLPNLAYDHKEMLGVALDRIRAKLSYTNIVFSLFADGFTLTDLQTTYEIILDKKLDKRNFRKKINQLDILEKVKSKKTHGAHRPAQVFKFKDSKLRFIDMI